MLGTRDQIGQPQPVQQRIHARQAVVRLKLLAQHHTQVLAAPGRQSAVSARALEHPLHERRLPLWLEPLRGTAARAVAHAFESLRLVTVDPVVNLAHAHERGLRGLLNAVAQRQLPQGQQAAAHARVVLATSRLLQGLRIPLFGYDSGLTFLHHASSSQLMTRFSQNFMRSV